MKLWEKVVYVIFSPILKFFNYVTSNRTCYRDRRYKNPGDGLESDIEKIKNKIKKD